MNHLMSCIDQIGHEEQHVGSYMLEKGIQVIPKRECYNVLGEWFRHRDKVIKEYVYAAIES